MIASNAPPGTADAYTAETQTRCRQGAEAACLLAILLVPLFSALDYVVYRECFALFLGMRVGCVAIMLLILVALRRPFGHVQPVALGVVIAGTVGLMIDGMTMFTGGAASPYYAGVNLVMVAVALLMPWPPVVTLLTCALLVGCYVACTLVTDRIADVRPLVSNLFFLTTTATITVVSAVVRERLRRQEFDHRTALVAYARKFTDHGSIRLEGRHGDAGSLAGFTLIPDIGDGGRPPDGRTVVVLVRDTCIGIRGADVAALAADFQQVDTGAAARFG